MISLSALDYTVIVTFLVLILAVGLWMSRKASKNLESYFLGGRKLPWYMLGVTGMSNWFDLTGTMIITSFLFLLGPRGLFIEFRGGAVLVLAFMLAYTGKWHRRSGCMTPAEWATYRFGTGFSGELLRLTSALVGIITTIGMLAYFVRGATLFMGMIFPVDPLLLTVGILGLAAVYTVLSGFYGVVLTDLVQGVIMISGCIIISIIATQQVVDVNALTQLAAQVTGNLEWAASSPTWHADMPKGYEAYEAIMISALFYLARNILGGMGSGSESRFFAAKNSREASMQCLLQGLTVMFRWPLMISFAILGLFLVSKTIPDAAVATKAAQAIFQSKPGLTESNWHSYTSSVVHHPEKASPQLIQQLESLLGSDWQSAVQLIGFHGTVNPEVILPAVLMHSLEPGLRGLVIIALLSALMGALTGVVNGASALFVRDIYQNFLRPKAKDRELIFSAYFSSAFIIVVSFVLGLAATSINDLWSWIVMGLTAGALGPGILRLYWHRTNAWGMACGIFVGGFAAVLQRALAPGMHEWLQFSLMTVLSFVATIVGSLITKPTDESVVTYFYKTTRPFGWWGPFRDKLPAAEQVALRSEHRYDILTVGVTLVWQVCLFMIPMQMLTRNWHGLWVTVPIFLAGCVGLYFFWWKKLPPADEAIADFASQPPPHPKFLD